MYYTVYGVHLTWFHYIAYYTDHISHTNQNHKHTYSWPRTSKFKSIRSNIYFYHRKYIHEPIALHFMAHINGNGDAPSSYQQHKYHQPTNTHADIIQDPSHWHGIKKSSFFLSLSTSYFLFHRRIYIVMVCIVCRISIFIIDRECIKT